jgi:hypothetical protein
MTDSTSQPEPVDPGHDPGVDPAPDDGQEGETQPKEDPDLDKQPEVAAADAGLPSSPELDDDNVVVTPPNADEVPGSAAG